VKLRKKFFLSKRTFEISQEYCSGLTSSEIHANFEQFYFIPVVNSWKRITPATASEFSFMLSITPHPNGRPLLQQWRNVSWTEHRFVVVTYAKDSTIQHIPFVLSKTQSVSIMDVLRQGNAVLNHAGDLGLSDFDIFM